MIDSTLSVVAGGMGGTGSASAIAVQTGLIMAIIAAVEAVRKWGPTIIAWMKNKPSESHNFEKCPYHDDLGKSIVENGTILKGLVERADQHHKEQREDLAELKNTFSESIRNLWSATNDQAKEIAGACSTISYLRQDFQTMQLKSGK